MEPLNIFIFIRTAVAVLAGFIVINLTLEAMKK